jgi:hypothetical protein
MQNHYSGNKVNVEKREQLGDYLIIRWFYNPSNQKESEMLVK